MKTFEQRIDKKMLNKRIDKNNELVIDLSRFFENNVLFFTDKMLNQSGSHFAQAGVISNDIEYYNERYDYKLGERVYYLNDDYYDYYDDYNFLYAIKHCAKPIEDGYNTTIFITDYIYEVLKTIKGVDNICPEDLEEIFEDYTYNYDDKFMNSVEFINYCYDLIQADIIKYLEYGEEWNNISESDFSYYFKYSDDINRVRSMYSLNDIYGYEVEEIYYQYTKLFNKYKKEGDVIKPMFIIDKTLYNNINLVNRI